MSRPNPAVLIGFLAVLVLVLGGAGLVKGDLLLAKHEGDTLHLMQILFRMEAGEWPHLDFMTPIGVLAFAPIVVFLKLGLGISTAFFAAQILVAFVLAPAAIWVAWTRLSMALGLLFVAMIAVLAVALVHGEAQPSISVSMHYNRWAWALAFLAIATAVLPVRGRTVPWVDGVIIGLAMAGLALIKVTYFACFAPGILLALLMGQQRRTLGIAVLAGLVVVVLMTLMAGIGYWGAYVGDLLTVAGSETRPHPGKPLGSVVGEPMYIGASLAAIMAVIFLRQGKQDLAGLVLLVLLPGFFYVTFQNFGNDPQWLWILAVILFACLPAGDIKNGWGWNIRDACKMTAVAVLAFGAPSFLNLAYSPLRHMVEDPEEFISLLPKSERHGGFKTLDIRAIRVNASVAMDGPGSGFENYFPGAKREDIAELNGETLPQCEVVLGMVAWMNEVTKDLDAAGYADGQRIFAADIFSSFWLYGPLEPLVKGAPWYYGGLSGLASADHVLVPLCAISPKVRKEVLGEITEAGITLTEVYRSKTYILLKPEMAEG